jgi:hypothetical protein
MYHRVTDVWAVSKYFLLTCHCDNLVSPSWVCMLHAKVWTLLKVEDDHCMICKHSSIWSVLTFLVWLMWGGMSCTPSSLQAYNVLCLFYFYLHSKTASVSLKEPAVNTCDWEMTHYLMCLLPVYGVPLSYIILFFKALARLAQLRWASILPLLLPSSYVLYLFSTTGSVYILFSISHWTVLDLHIISFFLHCTSEVGGDSDVHW